MHQVMSTANETQLRNISIRRRIRLCEWRRNSYRNGDDGDEVVFHVCVKNSNKRTTNTSTNFMIIIEDLESTNVNKPTDKRIKNCNHQQQRQHERKNTHTFTARTPAIRKEMKSFLPFFQLVCSALRMYRLLGKRERNERKNLRHPKSYVIALCSCLRVWPYANGSWLRETEKWHHHCMWH